MDHEFVLFFEKDGFVCVDIWISWGGNAVGYVGEVLGWSFGDGLWGYGWF
jgi:hypothetical protein